MPQRRRVVHDDRVARVGERRQVGRAEERPPPCASRQHELLPRVPRAVSERGRRAQHLVAVRRQPRRQLARPALDAAKLGPRGCAGVDCDPSIGHHLGAL
jgi:hypothetical protein